MSEGLEPGTTGFTRSSSARPDGGTSRACGHFQRVLVRAYAADGALDAGPRVGCAAQGAAPPDALAVCGMSHSNVQVSNDPNQAGAVVNYSAPTLTPPMGTTCETVRCSPASGSFYALGATPVICTASGGAAVGFKITVVDTQPPTVTFQGQDRRHRAARPAVARRPLHPRGRRPAPALDRVPGRHGDRQRRRDRHPVDRGGHFAAWEEPELFSTEVRAAFRGLRH